MPHKRILPIVAICIVALVASACGSTKKATTATTVPSSPVTTGASPTTNPQNLNPTAPGLTATTMKIGYWWVDSTGGCAKIGINTPAGSCGVSDEAEAKAMSDYINAHGGIAGRQVTTVIYHTLFSGLPWAQSAQQACTYFTQDNPVFAMISQNGIPGESATCFAKHHLVTIDPDTFPYDNTDYAALAPYLYQPDHVRPDRWVKAYIDGLFSNHFFDGNVKIGLVRYDYAEETRVTASVLKPELATHNLSLTQEAVIPAPTSENSFGDLQTQLASTVLKFKSAGVNRVLFVTDEGIIDLFWYGIAQAQHYAPEYGLSSNQQMSVFIDNAPKGSFTGAVGIGWDPFYDVKPAQDPGGGAAADLCKTILNNPTDVPKGRHNTCDSFGLLKAGYDKAMSMGDITAAGFAKAVASLGTTFQPAEVFSDQFGPGLYDGPSTWMPYGYSAACNCFQYTGPSQPMPEDPVPGVS